MTALTPMEYADLKAQLLKDVEAQLLKPSRHENSDHLDGGLAPQKLAAVTATGSQAAAGSVMITDTNKRPSWSTSFPGKELSGGYTQGGGDTVFNAETVILTMVATGDGVTPVFIQGWLPYIVLGAAAGGILLLIRDVTAGTVVIESASYMGTATGYLGLTGAKKIAAFSGSHTFTLSAASESGTAATSSWASGSAPQVLRATWAG